MPNLCRLHQLMSLKKLNINNGFSLIEVLIFVSVFSLFFVMAAAVMTTSLKITKQNQDKILATHYAEDLQEWLEAEKNINWGGAVCNSCAITSKSGFTEIITQTPGTNSFCFNDITLHDNTTVNGWPPLGVSNCQMTMGGRYRRIATFSASVVDNFVNQVNVTISVDWMDGGHVKSVPLQSAFSIWE